MGDVHQDRSPEWPARIRNLIEDSRLHRENPARGAIAALWRKAVESARDAELDGISVDGALRAAYDAGHLATLAMLLTHGLRTGSGSGHHELAFSVASALAPDLLEDLVPDSMEVRGLRTESMYDPVITGEAERDLALAWMKRTLPAIRAAMVQRDPELASHLSDFP